MKITKRFYKEESNKWYIDIPEWIEQGLDKVDLEMVLGADELLDILSKNGNEINITFSSKPYKGFKMSLSKLEEDEYGATYNIDSFYDPITVWLCNVTKFVLSEFPDVIYLS